MNSIIQRAGINAGGTAAYIILVVSTIFSFQYIFPETEDVVLIPIAMLLLFVCSAAITGMLVFGKPAMLYLDGKKKEAVSLVGYTIGILVFITLLAFSFLIAYSTL